MPQIIDYSAKGCQPSEVWKDINCLCILRILSSVCDFAYLTLLLLLKSWQAQSRASRLATYPSGSSPIVPFSCQETERGVNHSCNPEVASRTYQEFQCGLQVHHRPPSTSTSDSWGNRPLGGFLERVRRRKTRRDLDKEILKQFLEKVSCVILDSLSFEKYHISRKLITEGKTQESPWRDSGEDRRENQVLSMRFVVVLFCVS